MSNIPEALDPRPLGTRVPTKVYSPGQVAGAAFVGSPIAGCILLASNFALFGSPERRQLTLFWGVLSTVAVFVLAFVLPENFPNSVLPAAYTVALHRVAMHTQGTLFDAFIESGGSKHSNWRVLGIGLACLVGVMAALFVVAALLPPDMFPQGEQR